MARFVVLLNFTEQGAKNIRESTSRAQNFKQSADKAGVKVEAQYWTLGRYDGLLILSGDSEQKILGLIAQLASLGNVRTETIPALDESALRQITSG